MKNFAFSKNAKFFIGISLAIIVAGLGVFLFKGFNLGIDFSGGTIITIDMGGSFETKKVEEIVLKYINADTRVNSSGEDQCVIRYQDKNSDSEELNKIRTDMLNDIKTIYPDAEQQSVDRVGATAGAQLIKNALLSILFAAIAMLIYVWIRFEFAFGVASLVCLGHDVLIMMAIVLIFNQQVNSSFIAAVLTILGYSINNTIVVFSRVREYNQIYSATKTRVEIVDKSIQTTLARSMNTSLSTLITVILVFILGGAAIREFLFALIVGLVAGTYSSVLIAGPLWLWLCKRTDNWHKKMIEKGKSKKKAKKSLKNA